MSDKSDEADPLKSAPSPVEGEISAPLDMVPSETAATTITAEAAAMNSAAETGLALPIREHLGRKLRATYNEIADKPAYLGDPAIPIELEYQISRLERREVIHNQGVKAVEAALSDIFATPATPKPDESR